jgi:hypothetical protein
LIHIQGAESTNEAAAMIVADRSFVDIPSKGRNPMGCCLEVYAAPPKESQLCSREI